MKSKILVADKSNMSGLYKRVMLSNYRELLFLVLIIILANSSIILLPNDLIKAFVKESGFIENAQVLCYVACAIISWVYAKKKLWKSGLSGGIIFVVFALRESDIQKRFTIMSVTKTKFFISPEVTLNAKLISGAVITSILIILILFIRKNKFRGIFVLQQYQYSEGVGEENKLKFQKPEHFTLLNILKPYRNMDLPFQIYLRDDIVGYSKIDKLYEYLNA